MPRAEEILAVCRDWKTLREMEADLRTPLGSRYHSALRTFCRNCVHTGRMEERRLDGRDTEYRTVQDAPPPKRICCVAVRILPLLSTSMDTVEIAEALGMSPRNVFRSLKIMQRKGLVVQTRAKPVAKWLRADQVQPLTETVSQETEDDGNRERGDRSRRI